MRDLTRALTTLCGILGLSTAMAVGVVACSGDDTVVPADGGHDATTDVTTDSNPPADASEAGDAADSGDAGPDAVDTGLPDVTPPPVDQFPPQVMLTVCKRISECCAQSFGQSPSMFDTSRCNATISNGGGYKNLLVHEAALHGDAGALVQYDPAAAAKCLQEILTLPCPPTDMTATQYEATRNDCYAALKGTIPLNGTGCTDDIHCVAGHCVGGTCVALVGDGGACTKTDDCAYRGTSNPNMFCNDDPAFDGGKFCTPRIATDASCLPYSDFDYGACTTGLCQVSTAICATTDTFIDQATCTTFTITDAGGGG